jgi:[acyl-carrier-protein] S-malonyltransferase
MVKRTIEGSRTISVATPDELDKFIEWVNNAAPTGLQQHEGEHLFAVERLVVSPASGVFVPLTSVQHGHRISIGQTLGMIGDTPVVSVFEGVLQAFIAVDGERVTLRQPIAWLRTI